MCGTPFLLTDSESKWIKFQLLNQFGTLFITLPLMTLSVTLTHIEELIEQGLMTEVGLAKINAAKQDCSWTILDAIEALRIPPDLKQALEANETVNRNFDTFNNSLKNILFWIDSAKRPETRLNRIEKTVTVVVQNKNP